MLYSADIEWDTKEESEAVFDRYELQINKMTKGTQNLSEFAVKTINKEYGNFRRDFSKFEEQYSLITDAKDTISEVISKERATCNITESNLGSIRTAEEELIAQKNQYIEDAAKASKNIQGYKDSIPELDAKVQAWTQVLKKKELQICFNFLNKDSNDKAIFIIEKLIAIIMGDSDVRPTHVKMYMENHQAFINAM